MGESGMEAMALGNGQIFCVGGHSCGPLAESSGTLYKNTLLWLVIDDEAEQLNECRGRRAPELT